MGEITAYLVGKVGPTKWGMVNGVVGAKFVSSDGGDHSTHNWGFGNWEFTERSLQGALASLIRSKIAIALSPF